MKKCKCGSPVETRPGLEYDLCYDCWWAQDPRNINHSPQDIPGPAPMPEGEAGKYGWSRTLSHASEIWVLRSEAESHFDAFVEGLEDAREEQRTEHRTKLNLATALIERRDREISALRQKLETATQEGAQAERSNWINLQEEYAHLRQRLETADQECQEQARLNGIGASREAALLAKLSTAEGERNSIEELLFNEAEDYAGIVETLCKECGVECIQAVGPAFKRMREALEKIADPRKRDHKEPDAYTELGCVMNIANEALAPPAEPHGGEGKE